MSLIKNYKIFLISLLIILINGKSKPIIPKKSLIDLHFHLDGSITVDIAKKLAKIQNIKLPYENDMELKEALSVQRDCNSLNEFLKCFGLPLTLMQTKEGITEAIKLVGENVKKQGIIYLEIRFAPQLHCEKGLTQKEVIEAALEGLKKTDLHINLILCLMRGAEKNKNYETIELAKVYKVEDHGVVAIDLAGAEAIFKTKDYENEFKLVQKYNIPFTIHAGEADGPESIKSAINFGTKRIGHGVRIIEEPSLIKIIKDKNIILEFCPTSNYLTKALKNFNKDYPLIDLLNQGVKVTLNTDDMAIERSDIRKEYEYMINQFGLTQEHIYMLLKNSIEAAFTSKKSKDYFYKLLNSEFNEINSKNSNVYKNIMVGHGIFDIILVIYLVTNLKIAKNSKNKKMKKNEIENGEELREENLI